MWEQQIQDAFDAIALTQKIPKLRMSAPKISYRARDAFAVSVVNPDVKIGHKLGKLSISLSCGAKCIQMGLRIKYRLLGSYWTIASHHNLHKRPSLRMPTSFDNADVLYKQKLATIAHSRHR
jgi:hypothetical protein